MSESFSELKIPDNCEVRQHRNILTVKRWNWPYDECLKFQNECQNFIRNNKDKKIYIFCNHPHVFTLGRGNERGNEDLVDFRESDKSILTFPLFNIKRGGGITFHHPGQWIFYPIVAISPAQNLETLMCWMLKEVATVLKENFDVKDAIAAKKLMGVWVNRRKIASIGLGVNRFVTEHGLALNLLKDTKMEEELKKISPCGLAPTTYLSLEDLNNQKDNLEKFHASFIDRLLT